MLTAYFKLSMNLVRDVVKIMEEGIMENFDDEASKPVSSVFAAPIPSSNNNFDEKERRKRVVMEMDPLKMNIVKLMLVQVILILVMRKLKKKQN